MRQLFYICLVLLIIPFVACNSKTSNAKQSNSDSTSITEKSETKADTSSSVFPALTFTLKDSSDFFYALVGVITNQ